MQQTFYLDIEEEISSVVDRLNKSMSTDNYFVVPKRALFLQSIVNLKLLKREADKVGKKVFIVTQDEIGASMAERSGIQVLANLESVESPVFVQDLKEEEAVVLKQAVFDKKEQDKTIRLNGVGSDDFYASGNDTEKGFSHQELPLREQTRTTASTRVQINSVTPHEKNNQLPRRSIQDLRYEKPQPEIRPHHQPPLSSYGKQLDPDKSRTLEKMFSSVPSEFSKSNNTKTIEPTTPPSHREKRIKKAIVSFVALCLVAFAGTFAYLFLPSAKIFITPNVTKEKIDLNLIASDGFKEVADLNMPIRVVSIDKSITMSHDVTSSVATNGKKAHGSVVIYNEYDSNPQTLVATTRLESDNGKIYRIAKNVVVPGTNSVAGEIKPGAVSVDIVADQAGGDFNIDKETRFTIPGFKGGPKYDKFYAKGSSIVGGSLDGETSGGGRISQTDIDNAKQKTEAALKDGIKDEIREKLAPGEIHLSQAEKIIITKAASGTKIGDLATSFDYTVSASVTVLVFSEDYVRTIIQKTVEDSEIEDVKKEIVKIEYATADADFDNKKLGLKVHAEISETPIIKVEEIQEELLGKTDSQLAGVLRKYPSIKNASIEFSPSFVTRVPQYSQRVMVEIRPENE